MQGLLREFSIVARWCLKPPRVLRLGMLEKEQLLAEEYNRRRWRFPNGSQGETCSGYTGARKSKRGLNGQADRMAGSFPASKIATSVEKMAERITLPSQRQADPPSAKPRITIPKDILSALEWKAEDQLYIEVKGETLLVKKAPCV